MKAMKIAVRLLCLLLIIASLGLLVLQFVPFWSVEDDTASISEFIWQPSDHKTIKRDFKTNLDKNFSMNDVYTGPVLVLVTGILAIVLCIVFFGRIYSYLASALFGFIGIWSYHSHAVFQLGANWNLHFSIAVAIAVTGILGAALCFSMFSKAKQKFPTAPQ